MAETDEVGGGLDPSDQETDERRTEVPEDEE